jgi:hypothetical protein
VYRVLLLGKGKTVRMRQEYANNFFFEYQVYLLCLQGILALKVVDELTMWFFTIGGQHYYYIYSKLFNIFFFS